MKEKTNKTNRELVEAIIGAVHPEADTADDETLFGIIYEDYEAYANLIETREADIERAMAEGELKGRNAQIEDTFWPPDPTDGIPALGGQPIVGDGKAQSIFDLALG